MQKISYTDSHCHLFSEYYDNIDLIVKNAKKNNINKIIVNATSENNFLEVIRLSKKYSEIYAAVGFQPEDLNEHTVDNINLIQKYITEITAIGEIGLDYYNEFSPKDLQISVFNKEMQLADKFNKPVIIHTHDAFTDTINIIKKYPKVSGVIHCFTGTIEEAREYVKYGYKLGIGGIVTFKNSFLIEVIKDIGTENIVLETDSPYLAPTPLRGKTNEPSYLIHTVEYLCNHLGITKEELSYITENNIKNIFDI